MKKIIISSVAILVAAELGATYYVGGLAEEKFRETHALLEKSGMITSQSMIYKRGIFSSEAETEVKLKFADAEQVIKVKHIILHGPIIVDIRGKNKVDFKLAVINSQTTQMPSMLNFPYTGRMAFSYRGNVYSHYQGGAFELKQGNNFSIQGPGWTSTSEITSGHKSVEADLNFPLVTGLFNNVKVEVKNINFNLDQTRSEMGEWLGKHAVSIGGIEQKEMNILVQNLKFSQDLSMNGETLKFLSEVDLGKVDVKNKKYGPLHLLLTVSNIDPVVLKFANTDKSKISEEEARKNLVQLLSRKPMLVIDNANLTLPEGESYLTIKFEVGGPDIIYPLDKNKLMNSVNGEIKATIPKEILTKLLMLGIKGELEKSKDYKQMTPEQQNVAIKQQLDLKIQKLVAVGILKENEQNYDIKITVINGASKELTQNSGLPSTSNTEPPTSNALPKHIVPKGEAE